MADILAPVGQRAGNNPPCSKRAPSSAGKTFAEAAASHIEHGGEARYLGAIIDYFAGRPLSDIHPFDIKEMARALYPGRSNATLNRQGLAPARAVMMHAYERGWCDYMRLRRFREDSPKRKDPASPAWLHTFVRQCTLDGRPRLAAMVLFMATSGARVTEAANLRWRDVNLVKRTALLVKTKTDSNCERTLADEVAERLAPLQAGANPGDRVFGFAHRQSVNARIRAVCANADISYKPSHTCGRHSFANITLDMGLDVRSVMQAGGWRSLPVFLSVYVRPHRNAGRVVADRFNQLEFRTEI